MSLRKKYHLLHLYYSDFSNGNIINWNNAEWEVSGMVNYNTDYQKICKPSELGLVLVPGFWTVYEGSEICKNLRGNMNVISNKKNNDEIADLMKNSEMCLKGADGFGGIWTGWWDEITEGKWISVPYSEPLNSKSFAPWQPGEPNGYTIENCASLHFRKNKDIIVPEWNDIDCNRKFCVACLVKTLPVFNLRGI